MDAATDTIALDRRYYPAGRDLQLLRHYIGLIRKSIVQRETVPDRSWDSASTAKTEPPHVVYSQMKPRPEHESFETAEEEGTLRHTARCPDRMSHKASTGICDLPSELIATVLTFLPHESYPSLCLTHSIFNDALADDFIWRRVVLSAVKRSTFRYSSIICSNNANKEAPMVTLDGTLAPIQRSPMPYANYHELYTKVFRNYGWMLGTFAGNCQWTGSVIEIFYNHISGLIECRKLQAYALFNTPRYYSVDSDVIWRDFDPVLQAWREPLFQYGNGTPEDQYLASITRLRAVELNTNIQETQSSGLWPTGSVPVEDRVHVHPAEDCADRDVVSGPFSDDLLALSRPILSRAMFELPYTQLPSGPIPRHTELFYRIPSESQAPSGFEEHSGLFMGDYSSHGPELIYLYYPTPTSLHAVKLTGDPHVPRGELTWAIDDITTPIRICSEREWPGARAYRGRGQISNHGFHSPTWIDTEVILYHAKTDELPHTVQSDLTAEQLQALLDRRGAGPAPSVVRSQTRRGSDNTSPLMYEHRTQLQDEEDRRGPSVVSPPSDGPRIRMEQASYPNHGQEPIEFQVEKAGIVLWWKDMAHLSQFHRIQGVSDHQKTELERELPSRR